jgi:exodeoxyribonuclease VII large subunit
VRQLDGQAQRLDFASSRLGRPSAGMARAQARLTQQAQRARYAVQTQLRQCRSDGQALQTRLPAAVQTSLQGEQRRLDQLALRLRLLDPSLVLQRGYAWLHDRDGQTISSVGQTRPGQRLQASLADGQVDLTVSHPDGK